MKKIIIENVDLMTAQEERILRQTLRKLNIKFKIEQPKRTPKIKYAICNINIQIPVPENATEKQVQDIIENYELPSEYVEGSFEFQKVVEE